MADIAEFINAQLDEREKDARMAAEMTKAGASWTLADDGTIRGVDQAWAAEAHPMTGPHIARNAPERTFAEVDAQRRTLALHQKGEYGECVVCDVGAQSCGCCGHGDWPCATVRLLALPYAGKPGYQEDWRP
jgi:hypothetical protein